MIFNFDISIFFIKITEFSNKSLFTSPFFEFYTNADVEKINRKLNVEIYKLLAAIMVHNVAVLLPFNDHQTNKKKFDAFL